MKLTTAQKHLAAIHAGTITKTNMIGIRKALNHVDRLRNGYSGNRSSVTPAEADALETALHACRPLVTGELHASGLALLRSPRYAKRLANYRDVIDAPDLRFQLMRFDRVGEFEKAVPVYRAATLKGSFEFFNIPWQSGGDGPEIVKG